VTPDRTRLAHQGVNNEAVDIFFEQGALAKETRGLLQGFTGAKLEAAQTIAYTTLDSPETHGDTCRTFVNVAFEKVGARDVEFFQRGLEGGVSHREIELKSMGARLVANLQTTADDSAHMNQPGCRKLLQVGAGQIPIVGVPLTIVAEAGSSIRLKFMPTSQGALLPKKSSLFEPFAGLNLRAQSVLVTPIDSAQELIGVKASDGSVYMENLLVGSDELRARVSGTGLVTKNGRPVGPRLQEWVAAGPGRVAVVAVLNLAVMAGALFLVRPPRRGVLKLAPGLAKTAASAGLRVFLCHCSEDKPAVRELSKHLEADGFQPWLDEQDIFPARQWNEEIEEALRACDAIAVCLSKVFEHKEGYVRKELRYALDIADEKEIGFLIPARLEECQIPAGLRKLQCVDLYAPGGYEKLKLALHQRAKGMVSSVGGDASV
jgi:hypothetical protein